MAPKSVSTTVRYSKPGTRPPVYLAGSFSNPAWQAAEMEYTVSGNSEYEFHKEVQIDEGREYQYKFRIGEGDWWVLNEDSPSGTDNAGNRNNLLNIPITKDSITEQPLSSMAKDESPSSAAEMDNIDTKSIEEKMGTREPSNVLFDDEIVKDSVETSAKPLQMPHLELPQVQKSPPANEIVKPTELNKESFKMLDGTGREPSTETEHTHLLREPQHKVTTTAQTTRPQTEKTGSTVVESSFPHTTAVAKKSLNETALASEDGQAHTLTIKEIDAAQDDDSVGATILEKDHGSEPGYVMVEDRALTPELANTAAEVADSAAALDPRQPTPPMSDEEAGRIGYRRMSHTPIPQVAETAAEVADVAAELDRDTSLEAARAAFEASLTPEQREYVASGRSTPEHEKVPLFPHEMPTPPDQAEQTKPIKESVPEIILPSPFITQEFDPDELEPFPTDREEIMEHLRLMQERLPEDEVHLDVAPAPSAVIFHRSDYSPSLGAEGKSEDQNEEVSNLPTLGDMKEEPIFEQNPQEIVVEDMKSVADAANEPDNPSQSQVKFMEPPVLPGLAPQAPVIPNTPFVTTNRQLGGEEDEADGAKSIDSPKINLIPATPAGSSIHTTDPLDSIDGHHGDTGKSTAMEDNPGVIRARKQNQSPIPDRPLTPSSMRSAGKDAHERNFLNAFYRLVFVDWIGGLILRLCGGSRRKAA